MNSFEVIKATGEREKFKLSKLKRSLSNAGAQPPAIKSVINNLEENGLFRDGITTKEIYREAYRLIKKNSKRVAGRYKLKEALMELGPSGYPFENLISEIFKQLGYTTQVGKIIQGKCVSHEIDVIANDKHEVFLMECKFHNRQTHFCNVTIPLYVQSRFQDIVENRESVSELENKKAFGYLVTNTRFTEDAIEYAECRNMKLLSWDYPQDQGLKSLLDETNIHPITSLSNLTKKEAEILLDHQVVHCQQLLDNPILLDEIRFNHVKKQNVLSEAEDLCSN